MIEKGVYRHYKGKEYEVLDVAIHSETDEVLVAYKPLYDCVGLKDKFGLRPMFVRPLDMFLETVAVNGKTIKRFEYIKGITS